MSSVARWWTRLGAVVGAMTLAVFVPVVAWASSGPGEVAVDAARRRSRGGFGIGTLCCLVVVGIIVVAVVLLMRRRGGGRR
jgi:hypothetical protein